jgi:hypothetical protein
VSNAGPRTTIAKLEQRLTELPVLPVVLLELLRLDPAADDHYEQVSRLIGSDPALATRVRSRTRRRIRAAARWCTSRTRSRAWAACPARTW